VPKITNTNQLTQYALKVIKLAGYHAWRQNNGGVWDERNKAFRKGSSTPGIADIMGFHLQTGVVLACEIKVGKDRLSEAQTAFHAAVSRAGGLSLVIRHGDDLIAFANTHNVNLNSK
jgi:hypothetical protein